jgi:hypothetical protein
MPAQVANKDNLNFIKEIAMATESAAEQHAHTKAHDGDHNSNHGPTPTAKSKSRPRSKSANGRHPARASHRIVGELAESLTLGGVTTEVVREVSHQITDLKERGLQVAKAVEQTIVKNPKTTVLIVFGAGYLWGRLRKWL